MHLRIHVHGGYWLSLGLPLDLMQFRGLTALYVPLVTISGLSADMTKKRENSIKKALAKLQQLGELSDADYSGMRPQDSTTLRFHGLSKVHKEGVPLRPIVSLTGAPTYKLSKELRKRLLHLVKGLEHSIKSTDEF